MQRTIFTLRPERALACLMMMSLVAGCAELRTLEQRINLELGGSGLTDQPQTENPGANGAASGGPIPAGGAQTADSIDRTSEAERAAARRVSRSGAVLGQTVASLGAPAEQGFWLKTPLVAAETPGVVTSTASGTSVAVTLIPIGGPDTAGSRISLAAMRALEVPLTALVTLSVRRGG
ncbi:hypothetical protein [uncultured Roseobacter sp.]|uniref:hypothetical protein n=1 Tax=uncultured Roseobacter sp. TaxID=114847 RepID=UPI00262A7E74|nr:hypothetical protein [uncultured Roseobacter sp.]